MLCVNRPLGVILGKFSPGLLSAVIAETRIFRMFFSSSIFTRNLGHSRMLLVGRLPDAVEQCRKRCMMGCACSQWIFFSAGNPGVVGGPNGMHLTQGDCVEELLYFAEPLKLSCLKSFTSLLFTLVSSIILQPIL